ncbi:MAG: class I SAM-dependent methyltransferase [Candidatus Helarchaeota archaeon]|nr:class I SAM-dependent methyltransferase [Candidatus Helarchaeota archaeon]
MSNHNFNIYFEKFPLWKGVASRSRAPEFYPFSLGWHELGFLYQNTPKAIIDRIIQSYSLDEYQFITSPPGSSSWGNARAQDTIKFILEAFGSPKGASILEIGAGTTFIAEKLVDEYGAASYTVMDPTISETSSYPSIKIVKDYFKLETCPQEAFDLVLSVSTLEHVEDPVIFLKNVQKVLSRKNGKAILIFPDCEKQLFSGDFNVLLHEHISYFTKSSFSNVARLCNLEIISYKSMYDGLYCMLQSSREAADNAVKQPLIADGNINRYNAAFQESIDYLKTLLNQFIEANQKVAFHGACN